MLGNDSDPIFLLVYLALMDLMWGRCLKLVEGLSTKTVSGNGASLASSPPALFGKHHPKGQNAYPNRDCKKENKHFSFSLSSWAQFTVSNVPLYSEEQELIFFSLKLLIGLLINFSSCCYQVVNWSYENNHRSIAVILRQGQVYINIGSSEFQQAFKANYL